MEIENKLDLQELPDEIQNNDANNFEETYDEPLSKFDRIVEYFETDKGDVIINRIVSIGEQLAPAAKLFGLRYVVSFAAG